MHKALALVAVPAVALALALAAASPAAAGDPGVTLLDQAPSGATKDVLVLPLPEQFGTGGAVPAAATPTAGVVDVFTRLNVRSGPGLGYGIVGSLDPGERLDIDGEQDGWYRIQWRGRTAWVCAYYVWSPGKGARNPAVATTVRQQFPGQEPAQLPPVDWAPVGQEQGVWPAAQQQQQPVGSVAGQRRADGGLDVPQFAQFHVGGKYPRGYCGPTALKMALKYYGIDKSADYLGLTRVGGETPVYTPGHGSSHQGMLDMVRSCGLRGSTLETGHSLSWLKEQTDRGAPVIVGVHGNYGTGRYSSAGHILVVCGVTADGRVTFNDPGNGRRYTVSGQQFYEAWSERSRTAIVVKP